MQLAAKLDLTVHQLDVKTAYLNAPIDCEIYLEQAEGYEVPGKDKKLVYKLNKSLYGLKQSGKNWNSVLNDELIRNGFKQSLADPYMYVKHDGKDIVVLLIWVDDIIIASSNVSMLGEVKAMLSQKFNPIRPGGGLRGLDGQTHSCQSETSYPMMPKLGDF